jgi:hypothetical protein
MGTEGSVGVGIISLAINGARALPIIANCSLSTGWGTGVDLLETSARAVAREKTSEGAVPWYGREVGSMLNWTIVLELLSITLLLLGATYSFKSSWAEGVANGWVATGGTSMAGRV